MRRAGSARRRALEAAVLLAALAASAARAESQRIADGIAGVVRPAGEAAPALAENLRPTAFDSAAPRVPSAVLPPLASAIVPGSGQALLRQDRFVAYLAVEAYAWLRYATDVSEAKRQRRAYRSLAGRVARSAFVESPPTGDFAYYERMKYWLESGVFDGVPGGDIEPEGDTTTYNGAMWLLARRTYWMDPDVVPPPGSAEYRQALDFYVERAVPPEYRWSWRGAELEQDVFGRTIDRSNAAYRRAFEDLGLVIANHVLSTIDAYVTVRLRARREPGGSLGLAATVPWTP